MKNKVLILLAVVVIISIAVVVIISGRGEDNKDNQTEECGYPIEYQGYNYSTVQIGDKCWFSENCRYIPIGADGEPMYSWETEYSSSEPLYYHSWFKEKGGVRYNASAALDNTICPKGWHLATEADYTDLINYTSGLTLKNFFDWYPTNEDSLKEEDASSLVLAANSMKSLEGWERHGDTLNGSNSSGFNGLPGGRIWPHAKGSTGEEGDAGYWWVKTDLVGASEPFRDYPQIRGLGEISLCNGSPSLHDACTSPLSGNRDNSFNNLAVYDCRCVRD
jgi:uncharacterized protein (TIGR02145 family)